MSRLGVWLALLGLACSARVEPPPLAPVPQPSAAVPPPTAPVDEAEREVQRTLELVGEVRGLAPRRGVRGRVITREEMVAHVQRQLREDIPPAVVAAQGELLFALRAVGLAFDYEQALLRLMEDQLAGFYVPEEETMYLGADLVGAERFATLAHELVHALQDQHFDLEARIEYRDDANDEQSAVHALAEGDATSAMFDILQGRAATELSDEALALLFRGSATLSSGPEVPLIVKRSLVAPYVDGLAFVHWARRRGGWRAVDDLWCRAPISTEQVLHPEKWLAGEAPITVAVPNGGPGLPAPSYHDVMGEQGIRLVFEEWMPRFRAAELASGWGGDRVAVFAQEDLRALAWRIEGDDLAAAERLSVGFARGVLGVDVAAGGELPSDEAARAAIKVGEVCRESRDRGPLAIVRVQTRMGVVAGPYRRSADRAVAESGCKAALAWARAVAQ